MTSLRLELYDQELARKVLAFLETLPAEFVKIIQEPDELQDRDIPYVEDEELAEAIKYSQRVDRDEQALTIADFLDKIRKEGLV
ncbi:MAG: hypothetical protein HQK57_05910 [Deltaproteobacteria bacterium]|nr:hypothetical protein [Deltaproteobacteria bacterium]MBF0524828.1 hypothetical protein [Deltaproteobacteria bacterium]